MQMPMAKGVAETKSCPSIIGSTSLKTPRTDEEACSLTAKKLKTTPFSIGTTDEYEDKELPKAFVASLHLPECTRIHLVYPVAQPRDTSKASWESQVPFNTWLAHQGFHVQSFPPTFMYFLWTFQNANANTLRTPSAAPFAPPTTSDGTEELDSLETWLGWQSLKVEIYILGNNLCQIYLHIQGEQEMGTENRRSLTELTEKLRGFFSSRKSTAAALHTDAISLENDARNVDITMDLAEFLEWCTKPMETNPRLHLTPFLSLISTKYLKEYRMNEQTFRVYQSELKDSLEAQAWHASAQKLAPFFIEGADDVDVSDARWVVYYLLDVTCNENSDDPRTANVFPKLSGYVTVFKFCNPVKGGESHRICQALLLPPYQRKGHGQRILESIYEVTRGAKSVYEITVEDPVPGFARLRDLVDIKSCREAGFFALTPAKSQGCALAHGTNELTEEDSNHVQKMLKLTKGQVRRCYECFKWGCIDIHEEALEYKPYRLEIKRRLHKELGEELTGMGTDRKKAFLEEKYMELENEYTILLAKSKSVFR